MSKNLSQSMRDESLDKVIGNVERLERNGVKVNDSAVAVALWIADAGEGNLEARLTYARDDQFRPLNASCAGVVYEQAGALLGDTTWDKQGRDESTRHTELGRNARLAKLDLKSIYVAPENINGFLHEFGLPTVKMADLWDLLDGVHATKFSEDRVAVLQAVCDAEHQWLKIDGKPLNNLEYLFVMVGHCSAGLRQQLLRAADSTRVNVMQEAIRQNRNDWVVDMLDAGLSPDRQEEIFRWHSLQVAQCNPEAVRILIAHGANVNAKDRMGETPLHFGVITSEVCRQLLEKGADPGKLTDASLTPLHLALTAPEVSLKGAEVQERIASIHLLLDAGADPFYVPPSPPKGYLTPFQHGVAKGTMEQVNAVIQRVPVDFAQRTIEGRTLAQVAGKNKDMKTLLRSIKTHSAVVDAIQPDVVGGNEKPASKARGLSAL